MDAIEIDKYPVASYNAIYGENIIPQSVTDYFPSKEDLGEVDLVWNSSPCQDISTAGKGAGAKEGSGTRSSLVYEAIRIVSILNPKFVIWENVKGLVSKKHRPVLDDYIDRLNELGYRSQFQILNAKDYGIPQNRERIFVVSVRNDVHVDFTFPLKQELKLKLKDILEDDVDEKYYLSDEQVNKIKNSKFTQEKARLQEKDYSDTLLARDWKDPKRVEVNRKYGIFDTEKQTHQAGSVYDESGLAPTLDTMQGGWRQPCIEEKSFVQNKYEKFIEKQGYLEASDGDGCYIQNIDKKRGTVQKEMIPTLKTSPDVGVVVNEVQKDNYVIGDNLKIVETYPSIIQRVGDRGKNNFTVNDKTSYTIPANPMSDRGQMLIDNELRIRKLTPKECWRLMGFDDNDFEKAEKVNSNTQLYKQAGNSVVVNAIEAIFDNLLVDYQ